MFTVKADRSICQGYGNCAMDAPESFDLDDDGLVVALKAQFTEDEREVVAAAVHSCPVRALSLAE
ncbi:ferredoxin [Rhodococcus sp. 06-462-5]|uniref:ferredoxin n=1 Tax=unclassified Rhodococcus (in: high G+C Gram-positive bacteria) TaxID=192944 RepID=UPI000B9A3841|nr:MULTISPECIES: ferredoxin [unclassified Rhodococcus (in: high G+C Gram-positive bacteria)]OZC77215.1 ferredoxin [Rhodococcus sp. 06-462-5]OZE63372.1 ferredoxin [Rhodococcus sp. 02-925g]